MIEHNNGAGCSLSASCKMDRETHVHSGVPGISYECAVSANCCARVLSLSASSMSCAAMSWSRSESAIRMQFAASQRKRTARPCFRCFWSKPFKCAPGAQVPAPPYSKAQASAAPLRSTRRRAGRTRCVCLQPLRAALEIRAHRHRHQAHKCRRRPSRRRDRALISAKGR